MPRHKSGPRSVGVGVGAGVGGSAGGNGKEEEGSPMKKRLRELERRYSEHDKPTDFEEVWFAGAHCG
jgi:hypothetical protein